MFEYDLRSRQLQDVKDAIEGIGEIDEKTVSDFLDKNQEELYQFLMFNSAKYIKRLSEKKYEKLLHEHQMRQ